MVIAATSIADIEESGALKCSFCHNVLPEPRETSYVGTTGLEKRAEYVCEFCGTKILVPLKET